MQHNRNGKSSFLPIVGDSRGLVSCFWAETFWPRFSKFSDFRCLCFWIPNLRWLKWTWFSDRHCLMLSKNKAPLGVSSWPPKNQDIPSVPSYSWNPGLHICYVVVERVKGWRHSSQDKQQLHGWHIIHEPNKCTNSCIFQQAAQSTSMQDTCAMNRGLLLHTEMNGRQAEDGYSVHGRNQGQNELGTLGDRYTGKRAFEVSWTCDKSGRRIIRKESHGRKRAARKTEDMVERLSEMSEERRTGTPRLMSPCVMDQKEWRRILGITNPV